MSFFKKLFGSRTKAQTPAPKPETELPWIEPADNPWGVRLLDLRPLTQTLISASENPKAADNALSYGKEDGRAFYGKKPFDTETISSQLSLPIDGVLPAGVLFTPRQMEHKWAIYFDGTELIFVRSWQRAVFATARTYQKDNRLWIESITGTFAEGIFYPPWIEAMLSFLLISHSMDEVVPMPLPATKAHLHHESALWAFSLAGNKAQLAVFDETATFEPSAPLRSDSLLHIAAARGDVHALEKHLQEGIPLTYLACDGRAPLHWSVVADTTATLQKLLQSGTDPDIRSTEGMTPLMSAAEHAKIEAVKALIQAGATVNTQDVRGFTALHRACEKGHIEIVAYLLQQGADRSISANGHTALSLAQHANQRKIITMLSKM